MNFSTKPRLWIMALAAVFLLTGVMAHMDSALAWGKKDKEEDVKDPRGKAVNLNLSPEMTITQGRLQMDSFGQWMLDGTFLLFDKDSRIGELEEDPSDKHLQAGREAMVIGTARGGSLLVHRITMISPDESTARSAMAVQGNPKDLKRMDHGTPQ